MSFFVEAVEYTDANNEVLQEEVTVEKAELDAMLGEIKRIGKIIGGEEVQDEVVSDKILQLTNTLNSIKSQLKSKTPLTKSKINKMNECIRMN